MPTNNEATELLKRAVREEWPLPRIIDEIETLPEAQRAAVARLLIEMIFDELYQRSSVPGPKS
jgi:hypothetical protein